MIFLRMIYDIPKDLDGSKTYSINYTLFDYKQNYKIDLSSAIFVNNSILIPLNRLRVLYFFANDRKAVNDFLLEQKV